MGGWPRAGPELLLFLIIIKGKTQGNEDTNVFSLSGHGLGFRDWAVVLPH